MKHCTGCGAAVGVLDQHCSACGRFITSRTMRFDPARRTRGAERSTSDGQATIEAALAALPEGASYDAFISYKHGLDKPVAAGLQSVLQTLGNPWWQRRTMRIFRDDTTLVPTHALWPSIERALERSRHLVLIASPEAAASPWVTKEVAFWLEKRDIGTLFIAVTDGDLAWDATASDFVWNERTPLPSILEGRFTHEPLWIDLRAYRGAPGRIGKEDKEFVSGAAGIAAAILGRAKEDLLSEELRVQKRNLAIAWSAAVVLAFLLLAAVWQRQVALHNELEAKRKGVDAEMQVALVNAERNSISEAINGALDAVDLARAAGVNLATHEADLYAISSKAARGLVTLGDLDWPDALLNATVVEAHPLPSENAICMISVLYPDVGDEQRFENCFSLQGKSIVARPDLSLGDHVPKGETDKLDAKAVGGKIEFRTHVEDENAVGDLVYSVAAVDFGQHLETSELTAHHCRKQAYLVLGIDRQRPVASQGNATPEDVEIASAGRDVYSIEMKSGAARKIEGGIEASPILCSSHEPMIAASQASDRISLYDLDDGYVVGSSRDGVYAGEGEASNELSLALGANGLALLPAYSTLDGSWTPPRLVAASGEWTKQEIDFPTMKFGGPSDDNAAKVVAMSSDGRYAWLLYDEVILTLWKIEDLGMSPLASEVATEPVVDYEAETRQVENAARKLRLELAGKSPLTCVMHERPRQRLVGFSAERIVVYDLAADKIATDEAVQLLSKPEIDCEDGLSATYESIEIVDKGAVRALCIGYTKGGTHECHFSLAADAPSWLDRKILSGGCHRVYHSAELWLCAQEAKDDLPGKDGLPTLAMVDWAHERMHRSEDHYFAFAFGSDEGPATFEVERLDACGRVKVRYTNNAEGGARQPAGAIILDTETGATVGRITNQAHEIYCTVDELVQHMKIVAKSYDPPPVAVGAGKRLLDPPKSMAPPSTALTEPRKNAPETAAAGNEAPENAAPETAEGHLPTKAEDAADAPPAR